jgi:hypothetical protein
MEGKLVALVAKTAFLEGLSAITAAGRLSPSSVEPVIFFQQ